MYTMNETEVVLGVVQPTRRRRHSEEFKAQVIRAARQPNVSIAAVALHYRLNANMLRTWITAQEKRDAAEAPPDAASAPLAQFVPLQLEVPAAASSVKDIEIEVRRGATTVTVRWPLSAASECSAWLQGWLR